MRYIAFPRLKPRAIFENYNYNSFLNVKFAKLYQFSFANFTFFERTAKKNLAPFAVKLLLIFYRF